jgi:single-stranded-DNA-specific exonuclease
VHVVALDPPPGPHHAGLAGAGGATVHLAWGEPEVRYTLDLLERTACLRAPAAALYRALRDGAALADTIAQAGPPAIAGRALRVLDELGLVHVDRATLTASVPPAERTDLALAPTARDAAARLEAARAYLGAAAEPVAPAAAPPLVAAA